MVYIKLNEEKQNLLSKFIKPLQNNLIQEINLVKII